MALVRDFLISSFATPVAYGTITIRVNLIFDASKR